MKKWNEAWLDAHPVTTQTVDGVEVLRVKDSRYVATKARGGYAVIDLTDRSDVVTYLKSNEVHHWLLHRYFEEDSND